MIVGHYNLKYALYKIVLSAYQLLEVGQIHPARERAIRALHRTVDYIEESLPDALSFGAQRELADYVLSQVSIPGHYMEFGVFMGGSIRHMAKRKPDVTFHGFDSFEGLPEAWSGTPLAGTALSVQGRLPRVPSNVRLYKGWFSDTLPKWCAQNPGPIALLHIDCDIYSSTNEVFLALEDRLAVGTIILFDEYFNYPNWEKHEFRAWQECVARAGISYEYLGYARMQAAVRITRIRK